MVMAIFQKNTGSNLDKQKIMNSWEQSGLLLSPTEDYPKITENSNTKTDIKMIKLLHLNINGLSKLKDLKVLITC